MKVVITGGAGFLGQLLIAEILKRTGLPDAQGYVQEIDGIIALDQVRGRLTDARVHYHLFGYAWRQSGIADAHSAVIRADFDDEPVVKSECPHGRFLQQQVHWIGAKMRRQRNCLTAPLKTRVRISLIFIAILLDVNANRHLDT